MKAVNIDHGVVCEDLAESTQQAGKQQEEDDEEAVPPWAMPDSEEEIEVSPLSPHASLA